MIFSNLLKIYNVRVGFGEKMQTITNATVAIKEMWEVQHPIMHKWFLFSGLAMFIVFAFLFFAI